MGSLCMSRGPLTVLTPTLYSELLAIYYRYRRHKGALLDMRSGHFEALGYPLLGLVIPSWSLSVTLKRPSKLICRALLNYSRFE